MTDNTTNSTNTNNEETVVNTTTDDTTATATATPDTATPTDSTTDADTARPTNEAAKYRRRLRDAEAERDTLAQRVETMQRNEVERIAGGVLAKPASMWVTGVTVAELRDETGDIDPDKVRAAAESARTELGLNSNNYGNFSPREGNPSTYSGASAPSWSGAFGRK